MLSKVSLYLARFSLADVDQRAVLDFSFCTGQRELGAKKENAIDSGQRRESIYLSEWLR